MSNKQKEKSKPNKQKEKSKSNKQKEKLKYYNCSRILTNKAIYNIIFGERSNGKTTACLDLILFGLHEHGINYNGYFDDGSQGAIIRRFDTDFQRGAGQNMFADIVNRKSKQIEKKTKGKFDTIIYRNHKWFLARYIEDENKYILDENPFCYAIDVAGADTHGKSVAYPNVRTAVYDEFLTRSGYLTNEFELFKSVVSTLVRTDKPVTFFLLGNTVDKYCPYFNEFGIRHYKEMEKGDIQLYSTKTNDGREGRIAVEYADGISESGKPSDIYFAFDNSEAQMITDGVWETSKYPHCPCKILPKHIVFTYYIKYSGELLQCEIVVNEKSTFTFIHRKTTDIKNPDEDYIYQEEHDYRPNYARYITRPTNKLQDKIWSYFKANKVFYQDNDVGEIVRSYIQWCLK